MKHLLHNLILLALLTLSTSLQGQDHPAQKYQIAAISELKYVGNDLLIRYSLPCGTEKVGLIIAKDEPKKLRLGILARKAKILCAGMPKVAEERISFVNYAGIDVLVKMAPSGIRNWYGLKPASDLRAVVNPKDPSTKLIQGVYRSECTRFEGVVVSSSAKNQLNIGFLESALKIKQGESCGVRQQIKSLAFLRTTLATRVFALDLEKQDPTSAFHLRIAEIQKGSLHMHAEGELSFNYMRRCNEAPIGIIIGKAETQKVRLGMLVAHYYNMKCNGRPTKSWNAHKTADFPLVKNQEIFLLRPSTGLGKYQILAPTQYAIDTRTQSQGLVLEYIGGCEKEIGAVYSRDRVNNLSVGVLQRYSGSPCKNAAKEVSLYQPYDGSSKGRRIFPMKINGATYF